jgi:hypothetical protein
MTSTTHRWLNFAENLVGHVAAIAIGFVMMIVGLGLGVTMIMLPVGIVIGLAGVAVFVSGIFGHFSVDHR